LDNDVMNGGGSFDWLAASDGNDILRGQEGDDNDRGAFYTAMFGGLGDDELYGGPGEDGMEGEQGTDEHFGGRDNDYIDAVVDDELGTQDLVDCGSGYDTAEVREPEDIVRDNCEEVTEVTTVAAAPGTTTNQDQQQQAAEDFLAGRGG
jgi:Ca2+-binding RTX toxin-like protein